uniref:(northern house mosquito) hypothetical protein n=1 Tax=Culex pipiens TaxID=7175 RepID=A0A8D8HAU8_CULPI
MRKCTVCCCCLLVRKAHRNGTHTTHKSIYCPLGLLVVSQLQVNSRLVQNKTFTQGVREHTAPAEMVISGILWWLRRQLLRSVVDVVLVRLIRTCGKPRVRTRSGS